MIERRPSRRQAIGIALTAAALLGASSVALGSGGAGASSGAGPTAAAEVRDLAVTDSERGTLARSDTTTVLYDGTGGRPDGGPAGADLTAQSAGQVTPAQVTDDPCAPGPTTSTSSTVAPSSTTSTTACDPPTTSTTEPPVTTTEPPVTTTEPPATPAPPAGDPIGPDVGQQPPTQGDVPADRGPLPDGGPSDEGADPEAGLGPSTATLTELLAVGEVATRGSVLYRADDEPIVALLSTTPLFRELRSGVDDGPDVEAIEAELQALGYTGFTVDERFDSATAAAVEAWEEDLGRTDPDGVVTVGEVRLLDGSTAVLEHAAAVGDLLEPDDAVLVLGAESRVVEADVEAAEVEAWAVGTSVQIEWADGTTSSGSIVEVGRDVTDSQVPVVIALEDGGGAAVPIGSRVDLVRTVTERPGAVAVPVSAVVQGADGPAVRIADGDEDRAVDVELGIVDDGWVEVTEGIDAGAEVRLPA